MASIARLYPILRQIGLNDATAKEFVEIIDESRYPIQMSWRGVEIEFIKESRTPMFIVRVAAM